MPFAVIQRGQNLLPVTILSVNHQWNHLVGSVVNTQSGVSLLQFQEDKVLVLAVFQFSDGSVVENEALRVNGEELQAGVTVLTLR